MKDDSVSLKALATHAHDLRCALVKGVCERHVAHDTILEKSERTDALGPVDDLVRHNKVTGLDCFLQAANGRKGDYGSDTDRS